MVAADGTPSPPKQRYYTAAEVALHSSSKDLWVSFLGKVYNLTPLVTKYAGDVLLKPILNSGGKDISHWFNTENKDPITLTEKDSQSSGISSEKEEVEEEEEGEGSEKGDEEKKISDFDPQIRVHIDRRTGCEVPFTPQGRFIHIPPPYPSAVWSNDFGTPWWKDEAYCIGHLSQKTRKIRIINTLTSQEHTIELCSEEIMEEILNRFYKYNQHANSYTWKYNGNNLDMQKTLEQNGVKDEDEEFYELNFNEEEWLPSIHLYFNDDLTEA